MPTLLRRHAVEYRTKMNMLRSLILLSSVLDACYPADVGMTGLLLGDTGQNDAAERHKSWLETNLIGIPFDELGEIRTDERYGSWQETDQIFSDVTNRDTEVTEGTPDGPLQILKKRGLTWPQCLGGSPNQAQTKGPSKEWHCKKWCKRCSRKSPESVQSIDSLVKCEGRTGKCDSIVKGGPNRIAGGGAGRTIGQNKVSLVRAPSTLTITGDTDFEQNGVSGHHQGKGNERPKRRVKERSAANSRDGGVGLYVVLGCLTAAACYACCVTECE